MWTSKSAEPRDRPLGRRRPSGRHRAVMRTELRHHIIFSRSHFGPSLPRGVAAAPISAGADDPAATVARPPFPPGLRQMPRQTGARDAAAPGQSDHRVESGCAAPAREEPGDDPVVAAAACCAARRDRRVGWSLPLLAADRRRPSLSGHGKAVPQWDGRRTAGTGMSPLGHSREHDQVVFLAGPARGDARTPEEREVGLVSSSRPTGTSGRPGPAPHRAAVDGPAGTSGPRRAGRLPVSGSLISGDAGLYPGHRVEDLRAAGICDVGGATGFRPGFTDRRDARFASEPRRTDDLHRALATACAPRGRRNAGALIFASRTGRRRIVPWQTAPNRGPAGKPVDTRVVSDGRTGVGSLRLSRRQTADPLRPPGATAGPSLLHRDKAGSCPLRAPLTARPATLLPAKATGTLPACDRPCADCHGNALAGSFSRSVINATGSSGGRPISRDWQLQPGSTPHRSCPGSMKENR